MSGSVRMNGRTDGADAMAIRRFVGAELTMLRYTVLPHLGSRTSGTPDVVSYFSDKLLTVLASRGTKSGCT